MHEKFIIHQKLSAKSLNYPGLKKYKDVLSQLDTISNHFQWMFDYYKNCFYYMTENTGLFPNRENAFIPGMGYQCLIDNTHPDDMSYLLEIQQEAFKFLTDQKIEDRKNCIFAFKMRILTKSGEYLPFLLKIKAIALDKEGNLWMSMTNAVPSKSDKLFHPIVISTDDQTLRYFPEVSHSKFEFAMPSLSIRELEVLRLMVQNKTADEIIKELEITMSTLKNHKTSVFKKLNATNSIVAVENARLLGITDNG
jgi:DNA-binding CsgD family transcriptional regulator